ncbi:MAG: hypothetical protein WAS72_08740 [Saprospiraceae bacterium]
MKKTFTTILFLAVTTLLIAQPKEGSYSMSMGTNNGINISIKNTNSKQTEKEWDKFIDKYDGKTKRNKKVDEIFTDNATIRALSNNTVDVYAKSVDRGSDVEFTVWFDLGGAYLSSAAHPQVYPAAEKMVTDFAKEVAISSTEDELKKQEKILVNYRDDLESLQKKKTNFEDDIKKYEEKITETKNKIQDNIAAQKSKETEIEKQLQEVENVKQKLNTIKSY